MAIPAIAQRFDQIRAEVLAYATGLLRPSALKSLEMRKSCGSIMVCDSTEVKHASGGVVDLEFISQYLVLAYGCQQPALYQYSDNIRILHAAAAAGLMPIVRSSGFTAGLSGITRGQSQTNAGSCYRNSATIGTRDGASATSVGPVIKLRNSICHATQSINQLFTLRRGALILMQFFCKNGMILSVSTTALDTLQK